VCGWAHQLDNVPAREEDVGRLEVAVEHPPRVQILQRERHLHEPVEQLRLRHHAAVLLELRQPLL
jgi:hypothetical protein